MELAEVKHILSNLGSAPSGIRMSTDHDYRFEVVEISGHPNPIVNGFLIRCGFWRPDTNTGEEGMGYGRFMHVPTDCSETAVVMTGLMLIKAIVEHEVMEAFEYHGVKVVNPHKNLHELCHPQTLPSRSVRKFLKKEG